MVVASVNSALLVAALAQPRTAAARGRGAGGGGSPAPDPVDTAIITPASMVDRPSDAPEAAPIVAKIESMYGLSHEDARSFYDNLAEKTEDGDGLTLDDYNEVIEKYRRKMNVQGDLSFEMNDDSFEALIGEDVRGRGTLNRRLTDLYISAQADTMNVQRRYRASEDQLIAISLAGYCQGHNFVTVRPENLAGLVQGVILDSVRTASLPPGADADRLVEIQAEFARAGANGAAGHDALFNLLIRHAEFLQRSGVWGISSDRFDMGNFKKMMEELKNDPAMRGVDLWNYAGFFLARYAVDSVLVIREPDLAGTELGDTYEALSETDGDGESARRNLGNAVYNYLINGYTAYHSDVVGGRVPRAPRARGEFVAVPLATEGAGD